MTSQSDFKTEPNPDQPGRCPSIDPHDTLQCSRSIHEDDQCMCGGIGWKKGTPRHVSAEEKIKRVEAVLAEHWDWKAGRSLHAAVTAALGGDA